MTWTELPIEIKLAMFLNQALQGNPHSKEPFKKCIEACVYAGGFYWEDSIEGEKFWIEVLEKGNLNHFYTKYPKSQVEADRCDMEGKEPKKMIKIKIKQTKKRLKALKSALKILNENQ